jgi:hypothetical protein
MSCNKNFNLTGNTCTKRVRKVLLTATSFVRLRLSFRPGLVLNAVANGDQVLTDTEVSNFSLVTKILEFRFILMTALMLPTAASTCSVIKMEPLE